MHGNLHPITRFYQEAIEIFSAWGFEVVEGNEIVTEHDNFDVLQIDALHPARAMQDTLWLDRTKGMLLRTHTSSIQVPAMKTRQAPVRLLFPGKVYRNEQTDSTHTPQFHQLEGVVIGENITIGDLKGTLSTFITKYFGTEVKTRFRPSYFPFVEPGFEADMLWNGKWLEIVGCGMIHKGVLKEMGVDPAIHSGFAFGFGVERPVMIKYNISDIRKMFQNDYRLLKQF